MWNCVFRQNHMEFSDEEIRSRKLNTDKIIAVTDITTCISYNMRQKQMNTYKTTRCMSL